MSLVRSKNMTKSPSYDLATNLPGLSPIQLLWDMMENNSNLLTSERHTQGSLASVMSCPVSIRYHQQILKCYSWMFIQEQIQNSTSVRQLKGCLRWLTCEGFSPSCFPHLPSVLFTFSVIFENYFFSNTMYGLPLNTLTWLVLEI